MSKKGNRIRHLKMGALFFLCLILLSACFATKNFRQTMVTKKVYTDFASPKKTPISSEEAAEITDEVKSNQELELIDSRPYLDLDAYNQDIYESDSTLVKNFKPIDPELFQEIKGGIIPHHNLAHTLINDFYKAVVNKASGPSTYDLIVLISPNHKSMGQHFQIVDYNYESFDGIVETDQELVEQLLSFEDIDRASKEMISDEHGQLVHMPYIAHYFPETKILSMVITEFRKDSGIQQVASEIYPLIKDRKVLYIASIDFSHYLTLLEAQEMDKYTREQLEDNNVANLIHKSNDYIDSPSTYALFMEFMSREKANPTITNHLNAAIIMEDPFMYETTSYFQVVYD